MSSEKIVIPATHIVSDVSYIANEIVLKCNGEIRSNVHSYEFGEL
ncbi:MAG: hypothetical protein OSJ43_07010 [Oscillospiraceae bacterium]|nr:hypothetical protein [Oscillospiraceae bacterium]